MIRAFQVGDGEGHAVIVFAEKKGAAKYLAFKETPGFDAFWGGEWVIFLDVRRIADADSLYDKHRGTAYLLEWDREPDRRIYRALNWRTFESGEAKCIGCGLCACELDGCEVCDECHHCGECGCDDDCELRLDTLRAGSV